MSKNVGIDKMVISILDKQRQPLKMVRVRGWTRGLAVGDMVGDDTVSEPGTHGDTEVAGIDPCFGWFVAPAASEPSSADSSASTGGWLCYDQPSSACGAVLVTRTSSMIQ